MVLNFFSKKVALCVNLLCFYGIAIPIGWPSANMIAKIKEGGAALVPKFPRGVEIPERNVSWCFSFNNAEKNATS